MNEYEGKRGREAFIRKHNGKPYLFRNLPYAAQRTIIRYMDEGSEDKPFTEKDFNRYKYGYMIVKMEELKKFIMAREPDIKLDHTNFETYHKWYRENVPIPDHGHTN